MGSLYLGGPTIQEVDGEMIMGLSIYGVAIMDGSLYSRFYGIMCYGMSIIYLCLLKLRAAKILAGLFYFCLTTEQTIL